jgi:hypothetical protein
MVRAVAQRFKYEIEPMAAGGPVQWRRRKKFLNHLNLERSPALRRSTKGGSVESEASLTGTGHCDRRRSLGRMMYATAPAKSAKMTTTTTVSTRVSRLAP